MRQGHEDISVFADLVRQRVLFAPEGKDHAVLRKFVAAFETPNGHRHALTQGSLDLSPADQKGVTRLRKDLSTAVNPFLFIANMCLCYC